MAKIYAKSNFDSNFWRNNENSPIDDSDEERYQVDWIDGQQHLGQFRPEFGETDAYSSSSPITIFPGVFIRDHGRTSPSLGGSGEQSRPSGLAIQNHGNLQQANISSPSAAITQAIVVDGNNAPAGPIVTSVTTSGSGIASGNGDLNAGAVVVLTLHLSEAVSVLGGTPTLLLNDGGVATYAGGAGNNALKFSYTVAAGQETKDLAVAALDLNGATVVANPTTIVPGGGQLLTDADGHVFTFGDAYSGGDYHIIRDGVGNGIGATLSLVNGVVYDHTASFGWYADSAGQFIYQHTAPRLDRAADLSGAVANPAGILWIDAASTPAGPWVTSVTTSGNGITYGNGDLHVGAVAVLTLHLSEAASITGGAPTLLLNDGGVATYAGGAGTNALKFSYTVAAGQETKDLAVTALDLNGAIVVASPPTIVPGDGQSLTDADGHVFTFGDAYSGGDYHILRDGVANGIGATLSLVNGVVYDHTASFGWYVDSEGQFIYQQVVPQLNRTADLSRAVANPAGTLQVDTAGTPAGPWVTAVTAGGNGITAGNGDLHAGAVVILTLHLSEAVSITDGAPTLLLNDGGVATYAGGAGTNALKFSYTVAAGQNTSDLGVAALDLNGAIVVSSPPTIVPGNGQSLTDAYGHVFTFGDAYLGGDYHILRDGVAEGSGASLSLVNGVVYDHTASFGWYADSAGQFTYQQAAPQLDRMADLGGAVANPVGILHIDTAGTPAGPWVTAVTTSGNGISLGNGDLHVGTVVELTLKLSEAVSISGGVPTLLLNDGGVATYSGGAGTDAVNFSYTVAAGQNTTDLAVTGLDLNGAIVVASPPTILPGNGQSLTDAYGHVFTFGDAYLAGDYHILRDGVADGSGASLSLVNGVVYDHTASFGWYADSAGNFVYQAASPIPGGGVPADLNGAVTNPAGILQIDTFSAPASPGGPAVISVETSGNGIVAGSGDITVGAVVTFKVTLSEPVSVLGGAPSLHLNDDGIATYASGSGSNALNFVYTVGDGHSVTDLAITGVHLNGADVGSRAAVIVPGTGQSLTDANGHVFSFGSAYQGGDYNILRDGAPDSIGQQLALVHGVIFDETADFGWYADSGGHFVYQANSPLLDQGLSADLSGAVVNPSGTLHVDHGFLIS